MATKREDYNQYMRDYMRKRHTTMRKEAVAAFGGKCVKCGSTEKLEFDHIDRTKKEHNLNRVWSLSKERRELELAKCQLLCQPCHQKKTLTELGRQDARSVHGTLSSYLYCRCLLCKKAKADYMKQYDRKRKDPSSLTG